MQFIITTINHESCHLLAFKKYVIKENKPVPPAAWRWLKERITEVSSPTAITEYIALIQGAYSCWRLVYDVPTHLLSEGTHDSNQKINKPASYNGKVQVVAKTDALLYRKAWKLESVKTWLH